MTILITGAMGHVGYAAVRRASATGERVIAQYRSSYRSADAQRPGLT